MAGADWVDVDDYIVARLLPEDPVLAGALERNRAAGLPGIDVSPAFGQFLQILVQILGARRVLEIGTLGGYSTICLARGRAPGGRVVTLEYAPRHAAVARENLAEAGVADRVDLRVGAALDLLPGIEAEGLGPFDLIFIDADKASNAAYLDRALRLSRVGSVILCDNVVRSGGVLDAGSDSADVRGTRAFFDRLAAVPGVTATALQTVGAKGWDGFAMVRVDALPA